MTLTHQATSTSFTVTDVMICNVRLHTNTQHRDRVVECKVGEGKGLCTALTEDEERRIRTWLGYKDLKRYSVRELQAKIDDTEFDVSELRNITEMLSTLQQTIDTAIPRISQWRGHQKKNLSDWNDFNSDSGESEPRQSYNLDLTKDTDGTLQSPDTPLAGRLAEPRDTCLTLVSFRSQLAKTRRSARNHTHHSDLSAQILRTVAQNANDSSSSSSSSGLPPGEFSVEDGPLEDKADVLISETQRSTQRWVKQLFGSGDLEDQEDDAGAGKS